MPSRAEELAQRRADQERIAADFRAIARNAYAIAGAALSLEKLEDATLDEIRSKAATLPKADLPAQILLSLDLVKAIEVRKQEVKVNVSHFGFIIGKPPCDTNEEWEEMAAKVAETDRIKAAEWAERASERKAIDAVAVEPPPGANSE